MVFLPSAENIVSSDSKQNVFGNEILIVGASWNMSFFYIELIYIYMIMTSIRIKCGPIRVSQGARVFVGP